jgi:PAS domain S-box-containing protein
MSSKARILLVEREIGAAIAMQKVLYDAGYHVDLAHDAATAVFQTLEDYRLDLVLMDLQLDEEMGGIEAAERILVAKDIPIIFRNRSAPLETLKQVKAIPNYGCVSKEARVSTLIQFMEMALSTFRAERVGAAVPKTAPFENGTSDTNNGTSNLTELVPYDALWLRVTSDAIIILDNNLQVQNWNKTATTTYGWTFNEAQGKDMNELLQTKYISESQLDAQLALAEYGHWRGLLQQVHKDGGTLYVETSVTHLKADDGRIIGAMSVNQNVTERENSQLALLESEKKFSIAFESSLVGMALTTVEGTWIKTNSAYCQILGYTAEELTQLKFQDITHPDDLPVNLNNYQRLLAGEMNGYTMEKRYIHKSGKQIWVNVSVSLARNKNGEPWYFFVQLYDINAAKLAEERLKSLLREKEIILQEVHHRVKTNMNTIASVLELQADQTTDVATADYLKQAIGRIRSMGILYDKLYGGDDFRHLDIKDYLEELIKQSRNLFGLPSFAIKSSIENLVLPSRNVSAIGIIVNELLANGIQHAFPGRDTGLISLTIRTSGSHADLIYEDDGIGVPEHPSNGVAHFGMTLIELLTSQLKGKLQISAGEGNTGCRIAIRFPLKP